MFRFFIFLYIFTLFSSAKTIHFSEEKYHEALDTSFTKEGNITFLDEQIEIVYFEDNSKLRYSENLLIIEKDGQKREIDLSEKPEIKMFFTLFRAIYFDEKSIIDSFFTTSIFDNIITLTPLSMVSPYIEKVSYQKTEEKLIFLEIIFTLEDRIRIEELD